MAVPNELIGIHQADLIVRSAIIAAFDDLRANPWLLDAAFASLPQDKLTRDQYGHKEIDAAKKWFLSTRIPVFMSSRVDEPTFPCISITLVESGEAETTLSDTHYVPVVDDERLWPDLSERFTPVRYEQATGTLVVPKAIGDSLVITPGQQVIDASGEGHEILEVVDDYTLTIEPGVTTSFRHAVIKGRQPSSVMAVESVRARETYAIGCHVQGEQVQLQYLHTLLVFALYRYKARLLEARGFERSTLSSSDFRRNDSFETELTWSRHMNLTGYVTQMWPGEVDQKLTSVEVDTGYVVTVGAPELEPEFEVRTKVAQPDAMALFSSSTEAEDVTVAPGTGLAAINVQDALKELAASSGGFDGNLNGNLHVTGSARIDGDLEVGGYVTSTGTLTAGNTLMLHATETLTAPAQQGGMVYDASNSDLKVSDGTDWQPADAVSRLAIGLHEQSTDHIHGVTSALVGVDDAQVLKNKTLSAPIISGDIAPAVDNASQLGVFGKRWAYGYVTNFYASNIYSYSAGNSITLASQRSDGATSIGVALKTTTDYLTVGSKLVSIQNNATEKAFIDKDGALTVLGTGSGVAAISIPSNSQLNLGSGRYLYTDGSSIVFSHTAFSLSGMAASGSVVSYVQNSMGFRTDTGAWYGSKDTARLYGSPTDGATALGVALDTTTALTTAGAKLLSVRNNGVEKMYVDKDGHIVPAVWAVSDLGASAKVWRTVYANKWEGSGGVGITGTGADGATTVTVSINNTSLLTTAGAKLLSLRNNFVEKAFIDKDGGATWGGNLLPLTDVTLDLGSATQRWRSLFLKGATGATPLQVDQGNLTNLPSATISNVGQGSTGLGFTYAALGTFNIGGTTGTRVLVQSTNRSMFFHAIGAAYDASPQAFEFFNAGSGTGARTVLVVSGNSTAGHEQTGDLQKWNRKAGDAAPVAAVHADGSVEVTDPTAGIILRSPNGTRFRITVSDAGALTTTAI